MPHTTRDYRWRIVGRSEQGASHVRHNLPNQDAIQWELGPDGQSPVILAVADGHGSAKSFRSNVGAKLAVDVALRTLRGFVDGVKDAAPSVIKNRAEQQLPAEIAKLWREEVNGHFQAQPFTPEELDRLENESGTPARQSVTTEGKHYVVYGATILIVAVTDTFILYLQLGDGEILAISRSNGQPIRPLPPDADLIANETTSLCMEEAWQRFRIRFQHLHESAPSLIMVSTDGYPNSFSDFDGFAQAGADLLKIFATDGPEAIERDLASWLTEASKEGSGDDVTLGLIFQVDRGPMDEHKAAGRLDASADERPSDGATGEADPSGGNAASASKSHLSVASLASLINYVAMVLCVVLFATTAYLWIRYDQVRDQLAEMKRDSPSPEFHQLRREQLRREFNTFKQDLNTRITKLERDIGQDDESMRPSNEDAVPARQATSQQQPFTNPSMADQAPEPRSDPPVPTEKYDVDKPVVEVGTNGVLPESSPRTTAKSPEAQGKKSDE